MSNLFRTPPKDSSITSTLLVKIKFHDLWEFEIKSVNSNEMDQATSLTWLIWFKSTGYPGPLLISLGHFVPQKSGSQDSPKNSVINFFGTPSPQPNQNLTNLKFSTTHRWQWWGQSHGTGGTHYGQRQIGRPLWSEDISWGGYAPMYLSYLRL